VVLIYGSHMNTDHQYTFDYDPRLSVENDQYAFPNVTTFTQGDGTVPVSSSLIAGIKWAWEFDNKENDPNLQIAKPVKVLEWCSQYNTQGFIYDTNSTDKSNNFTQNGYIGLNCTCQSTSKATDGDDCVHGTIINDQYFVNFFVGYIRTNDKIGDIKNTIAFKLPEDEIQKLVDTCPSLRAPREIQDIIGNYTNITEITNGATESLLSYVTKFW